MKFSKKEKTLTYEELMNSHFMKYPSHPKWLHVFCNPAIIAIISLCITIAAGFMLSVDGMLIAIVAIIACIYWPLKQHSAHSQMSGHGVGIIRKSKFSLLGFTKVHSIVTMCVLIVVIMMLFICFTQDLGDQKTNANYRFFSIAVLTSFVGSLVSWRFHTYYETWYGDEYTARVQFKKKGFSDSQIEGKITVLRQKGILPPYIKK